MKLQLTAVKDSFAVCQGTYDVADASGFGSACADIWVKIADEKLRAAANVGAAYEAIGDNFMHDMDGVHIVVRTLGR